MLHQFVRSYHHLQTLLKEELHPYDIYFFQNGNGMYRMGAFKICRKDGQVDIFVAQQHKCSNDFNASLYEKSKADKILSAFDSRTLMLYKNLRQFIQHQGCIIFVDDIGERLSKFISNNKKVVGQAMSKIGVDCSNEHITKFIYSICNESPNLFAWAITCYYKYSWRINLIQRALYFATQYNNIVSKLSKGTVTAYKDWYELRNEIHKLVMAKKANDAINQFNTKQKKLLKQMELTDELISLFNKFQRLSQTKKINFIQKVSTIEDVTDIIKQLETLTNKHFDWSYDSLKSFIKTNEHIDSNTVFDNGKDFIILKLGTYDSIKYLAKSTNWCIAKNKKYWNQYINNNLKNQTFQFIMFDFTKQEDDELSIVGVTIDKRGYITAAHSFTNKNLLADEDSRNNQDELLHITPFVVEIKDIYSLLSAKHITIGMLIGKEIRNPYAEWTQKDFMGWLHKYFSLEDIDIHYDENGILVLSIPTTLPNQEHMRRMFGKDVFNIFCASQHCGRIKENGRMIYLCDFKQTLLDRGRAYITFTYEDTKNHVETNDGYVFNSIYESMGDISLKTLLGAFNIPLDTIKIPTDDITLWESCLSCCDFTTMAKLLSDKQFIHVIQNKKYKCDGLMRQMICRTLFRSHSLDLIDFIYDQGYKLSDFMQDPEDIGLILIKLYDKISNSHMIYRRPSKEAYERIIKHQWTGNNNEVEFIVYYHTFQRILHEEKDNANLFKYIMNKFQYFSNTLKCNPLTAYLINLILDNYEISTCLDKSTLETFLRNSSNYILNDTIIKEKVLSSFPSEEFINEYINVPCVSSNL